ncbi:MAG: hypothetical protein ACM3TU_03010 [Bacillota bacterium]
MLQKPKVVEADTDVIRLYSPASDTYVSVSFEFGTVHGHDRFLQSRRTFLDFVNCGGKVVIEVPHHIYDEDIQREKEFGLRAIRESASIKGVTERQSMTEEEMEAVCERAVEAYIASVQSRVHKRRRR